MGRASRRDRERPGLGRDRPLYEAGRYAEAADRGRELVREHPASAALAYNVACCESLAGRTGDAIAHLRRAFAASGGLRERAAEDTDLDALRGEPAFAELLRRQPSG